VPLPWRSITVILLPAGFDRVLGNDSRNEQLWVNVPRGQQGEGSRTVGLVVCRDIRQGLVNSGHIRMRSCVYLCIYLITLVSVKKKKIRVKFRRRQLSFLGECRVMPKTRFAHTALLPLFFSSPRKLYGPENLCGDGFLSLPAVRAVKEACGSNLYPVDGIHGI
jgi:hypothetical protein